MKAAPASYKSVYLALAVLISGCSTPPPDVAFSGKAVPFPVTFIGSAAVTGFVGVNSINSPVQCSYSFSGRSGTFVTPETIVFNHTDELKTLALSCSYETELTANNRTADYVGSVTGTVETSFSPRANSRTVGVVVGGESNIRLPRNRQLQNLRRELIGSRGVQVLLPVIVVSPKMVAITTS